MKRINIILLLCLTAVLPLQAQFAKPLKTNRLGEGSKSHWSIGLTGSFAANDMIYTAMNEGQMKVWLGPTVGIAGEYNAMQGLGVGLDVSYVMRGTKEATETTFLTDYNTLTSAHVDYEMSLRGVEMRIPVTLYLGAGEVVKPYVYLAPRATLWLGDSIRWQRTYDNESYQPVVYTHAVDKSTMKPYDVSIAAGVGFCTRLKMKQMQLLIKLDVNYGISVFNTFSDAEIAAANEGSEDFIFHGWGDIQHEELGRRHLQNAEVRLTVLVPLKKPLKDACAFDQRMRKGK